MLVVLILRELIILDSSAVEHSAVNRRVVGSNPTRGVLLLVYGSLVKRLRHGPFTAVTGVRFPYESFKKIFYDCSEKGVKNSLAS